MKFIKENWFKLGILLILVISLISFLYIYVNSHRENSNEIKEVASVFENGGNIFLKYKNNETKQLTFSGLDEQPYLSYDKKMVVLLRSIPGKVYTGSLLSYGNKLPGLIANDENGSYLNYKQIFVLNLSDLKEQKIFDSGKIDGNLTNGDKFLNVFNIISGISDPVFSLDDNKVFFMSAAWATSNAIFSVNLNTGQLSYITDGNSLGVLRSGEFKGEIVVLKHKYFKDVAGSYDHYFVVDDNGNEIKDVGDWDSISDAIITNLK